MLQLASPLELDRSAIESPNLCERLDATDLARLGLWCKAGYDRDQQSRQPWLRRNEAGMDLALQVVEDKNFPWAGCSNIKFPLVTIAAMQFHARAYPAILNGGQLVSCQVFGEDPSGEKAKRKERIDVNMSWQLSQQDRAWEEQTDRQLFNLSIVGCNFKKSRRESRGNRNVSELVLAKNLVVDYWTKSMGECPRKTHLLPLFRNEIREKVLSGTFRDVLTEGWYLGNPATAQTTQQIKQDNRQGVIPSMPDETTSFLFGEQHVDADLDGDGYAEPYLVTFEITSGSVVRIVLNCDDFEDVIRVPSGPYKSKILRVEKTEYFTKYEFIPSPDGGFYGIGFGAFLGPLNEGVNSMINQLVDAGTMQTTAGGFLARGAKMRGGTYTFAPLEWKRVDSTGDDLRKSVFPLPVREPSNVLFQLLSLLINYTNRISGATDMMVGENPGQNTPAETSRTMVEMGQKIYTALFKRIWRSLESELHKLYRLNGKFMDAPEPGGATRDDYLGEPDVIPAADPNITSDVLQMQQATAVKQSAMQTPGYNRDAVERRWLKSMKVSAIEEIFPGSEGQEPPKDPKIVVAEMKLQGQQMDLQARQQEFVISMMEDRRVNNAKILELMSRAEESQANAASEASYAQVAEINAGISAAQADNQRLTARIDHLLKFAELEIKQEEVKLKKKEPASASSD